MRFLLRRWRRDVSRGQGLVEMALILPLIILLVVFAIDFGRVFFGWVALNNMARVGANHAATNPDAWTTPGDAAARAAYLVRMDQDADAINCDLPTPLPNPTFQDQNGNGQPREIGDMARVSLTCEFSFITPIVGGILGDPLTISAESAFPIRVGVVAGAPLGTFIPLPSNAPTPTPAPAMCTVPDFVTTDVAAAQGTWSGAGFSTTIQKSPNNNSWSTVAAQSLAADSEQPCTSSITLFAASPSPTPTATPSPTPIPQCEVPSFIGDANNNNALRTKWASRGFVQNNLSRVNGNWSFVQSQTLVAGSFQPCNTAQIRVGP